VYLKMILGGLGGITPLFAIVLLADASVINDYVVAAMDAKTRGNLYLIGYGLKAVAMFAIGALWACLHKSEQNLLKVYQLGIVAPAMVLGTLTAHEHRQADSQEAASIRAPAPHISLLDLLVSPAYAQPAPEVRCASGGTGTCATESTEPPWYKPVVDGFLGRPLPPKTSPAQAPSVVQSTANPPAPASPPRPVQAPLEHEILAILGNARRSEDLRVSPPLDSAQIRKARGRMAVPPDETVLGFVSATTSRDGAEGLLFGTHGIYYHTSFAGPTRGPSVAFITYDDFAGRLFRDEQRESGLVSLDQGQYFSTRKSYVHAGEVVDLLNQIKARVQERAVGQG